MNTITPSPPHSLTAAVHGQSHTFILHTAVQKQQVWQYSLVQQQTPAVDHVDQETRGGAGEQVMRGRKRDRQRQEASDLVRCYRAVSWWRALRCVVYKKDEKGKLEQLLIFLQ